MTTLVSAARGLRVLALLSSDRLWFSVAVVLGLLAAGQIVEALLIQTAPDLHGAGF